MADSPTKKLADALTSVNWNENVDAFLKDPKAAEGISKRNLRLAVWARQFEKIDKGNAALCFIREMQVAGHHVAALTALALYKSAAAAMRTALETSLYYTYFRSHQKELATIVRDPNFFVTKSDLLAYHKLHTPDFLKIQMKVGLLSKLDAWYGNISGIVHGQVPGTWVEHKELREIKLNKPTLELVLRAFASGEEIINLLFLTTVGREHWDKISTEAKEVLISGVHGDTKTALGLDHA